MSSDSEFSDRSISSPPSSPGLLPKINEKDDDLGFSSDSDVWSLQSDRSYLARRGSSPRRRRRSSGYDDDESVELFKVSSDSYYSRSLGRSVSRTATGESGGGRRRSSAGSITGSITTSSPKKRSSHKNRIKEDEISPSAQIYKNLLILEETLRQQSAQQNRLKTKYTTFVATMIFGIVVAFYEGFGEETVTSSLWRIIWQIVFSIDLLTLLLYYMSGEYNRTITVPRKFLTHTNKGIRRLNIRLVKVKVRRPDHFLDMVKLCLLMPTVALRLVCEYLLRIVPRFGTVGQLRDWLVDFEAKLQTSPSRGGVQGIKLVLNPRVFSTGTREQWEMYRNEFWNRETIRRRKVLQKM